MRQSLWRRSSERAADWWVRRVCSWVLWSVDVSGKLCGWGGVGTRSAICNVR